MALFLLLFSYFHIISLSIDIDHHSHDHHHDHSNHRIHECANHKQDIQKGVNLHQIHVPYKNHPYERIITDNIEDEYSNTRRRALSESETAPIRISAYYDPDTILSRDASEIHELKAVVGAIVNYYENAIRVVPVDGTFYMERFCNSWYNGGPSGQYENCILFNGGSTINYCQEATVPDSHFREQYIHHYPDNKSAAILQGGAGNKSHLFSLSVLNEVHIE